MVEGVISVVFVGRVCLSVCGWMVVGNWARRWANNLVRQSLRQRLTSGGWLDLRQVTGDRETHPRPECG